MHLHVFSSLYEKSVSDMYVYMYLYASLEPERWTNLIHISYSRVRDPSDRLQNKMETLGSGSNDFHWISMICDISKNNPHRWYLQENNGTYIRSLNARCRFCQNRFYRSHGFHYCSVFSSLQCRNSRFRFRGKRKYVWSLCSDPIASIVLSHIDVCCKVTLWVVCLNRYYVTVCSVQALYSYTYVVIL
jgi:hypothetical protein